MNDKIHTIEGVEAMPLQLQQIPQSPSRLYYRGDHSLLYKYEAGPEDAIQPKILCIVGARRHTPYGKEACEKLISGLRGYPVIIVSGLARGIDCIAHEAALAAGLKTIAVPGSGIDPKTIYPAANRRIAERIIEAGGCIISEFHPLEKARPYFFPQRNRIMAGVSHAVLVIEAERPSGTLITSRLAQEYNRDVYAVPGSIFSLYSAGPHMLISKGATPITCSEELLEVLGFTSSTNKGAEKKIDRTLFDTGALMMFSKIEERLLKLLETSATKEQIIENIKAPMAEINAAISLLEINGFIKEVGGHFQLTKSKF